MDRYVIAGFPVKHSRSPAIHGRFAAATGEPVQYDRLEIEPGQFTERVRAFAAAGGRGCNVTVPYKLDAWQLAAHRTPRAELAGAANTLRFDAADGAGAGWACDNTDGAGLVHDITVNAGVALAGARVLLIGAGGAGLGALGPLIEARPAAIRMVNRTVAKAEQAVARHAALAQAHGVSLQAAALDQAGTAFDIVINATSSSLAGAASPVDATVIRPGTLVLDMMYGAAARPFLAWAQGHGAVVRDGLGMLVEQAAEAFAFWRGLRPPTDGVLAALRVEVDAG